MRKILNINDNWNFLKNNTNELFLRKFNNSFGENVNIPHTWNDIDGASGNEYFRGVCWYTKNIYINKKFQNKKIFLEFNGVNSICNVYVNEKHLGEHKGGYSTFRYDITDLIEFDSTNFIAVKVDNSHVEEVYPLMADFTFYGGIYRDVNLLIVDPIHFDLMDNGSKGVFVYQDKITNDIANLTIKTNIISEVTEKQPIRIVANLLDANGQVVKYTAKDILIEKSSEIKMPLSIKNPILWNGTQNPYLYTMKITIEKHNDVLDELNIPIGLRYFEFNPNKGFFLNGNHIKLKGISRHQDKKDLGWALSKEDHALDMALIKEVGANSIRLAHYQHDQYFYDLCDKEGMIVWAEIPFISVASSTDYTGENAKSQMIELIRQNFNHPSIIMWGVENEIQIGGDLPYVRDIVKNLNEITHKEDPTRLTTQALVSMVPDTDEYNGYTDIVAYNKYFGWYNGKTEDFATWLDNYHELNPNRCVGLSEYGFEGIITYHSDNPKIRDYTEEYHSLSHETLIKIFNEREFLWGSYVWNFFDFGSAIRDEGGIKGRNNKGLVTFDRKIKKDAFFAYKAAWSDEPFVHITSKRFIDRATDFINIKVYSNCDAVTLFVDNEKFATLNSKHNFIFENIKLSHTQTNIRAIGTKNDKEFTDYAFFNKVNEANVMYECPDKNGGFAANWFDEDLANQFTDIEITALDIPDDVFSSATRICDILENEKASIILNKYFSKLLASPMIGMIKTSSIDDLFKMLDESIDEKLIFMLNKELSKIKK